MKRILFIFGTRPEAIKLAPLIRQMRRMKESYDVRICVTAQHRQMLDQVLHIFDIVPDYDLNLMKPGQTLFDITSNSLCELRHVLEKEKPQLIVVQGDTTTVLAGAIAAYYLRIEVAHIEAGLRTNNKFSPFPEEANRRLCSVLADYHFAPTRWASDNLLKEGIDPARICITGNTVIDSLLWAQELISDRTADDFEELRGLIHSSRIILVTGHRRENFGEGFQNICQALRLIAKNNPNAQIIYPVHLNPNVRQPVLTILRDIPNVSLIEPLTYLPFVFLMKQAYVVLTDSGGVQEEAPSLGKPVLVMRNTTERPEAVKAGTVRLVGTDVHVIIDQMQRLLDDPEAYQAMAQAQNPYGDGMASERIACFLANRPWQPFCPSSRRLK